MVECFLKNRCSWNSHDVLESQKHLYSRTSFQLSQLSEASTERCSLKLAVIKNTSNFSKILVKYLKRSSFFVNLQAKSLQFYQKKNSFTVVFKGFSLLFYFFPRNTFEWLLPNFCIYLFV